MCDCTLGIDEVQNGVWSLTWNICPLHKAAPELLDALHWLVWLHSGVSKEAREQIEAEEWEAAIEAGKAAIAKAKGNHAAKLAIIANSTSREK